MSMPEPAYLDENAGIERNDKKFRTLSAKAHGHSGIARLCVKGYNATQSVRADWNFSQN